MDWRKLLYVSQFSYNLQRSESTILSPFEIVTWQQPLTPSAVRRGMRGRVQLHTCSFFLAIIHTSSRRNDMSIQNWCGHVYTRMPNRWRSVLKQRNMTSSSKWETWWWSNYIKSSYRKMCIRYYCEDTNGRSKSLREWERLLTSSSSHKSLTCIRCSGSACSNHFKRIRKPQVE